MCATWCPLGSACKEHGGLLWADAGARAAMLESYREQGISLCPYQRPCSSVRQCDPEIWGPDVPDTSEASDQPMTALPMHAVTSPFSLPVVPSPGASTASVLPQMQ